MNKRHFLAAAAVALTAAAGSATQASETIVPETTIPVPAITVSPDGELQYSPEYQHVADNDKSDNPTWEPLNIGGCPNSSPACGDVSNSGCR